MTSFPVCFLVRFELGAGNRSAESLPYHEEDILDWLDYDPYSEPVVEGVAAVGKILARH